MELVWKWSEIPIAFFKVKNTKSLYKNWTRLQESESPESFSYLKRGSPNIVRRAVPARLHIFQVRVRSPSRLFLPRFPTNQRANFRFEPMERKVGLVSRFDAMRRQGRLVLVIVYVDPRVLGTECAASGVEWIGGIRVASVAWEAKSIQCGDFYNLS